MTNYSEVRKDLPKVLIVGGGGREHAIASRLHGEASVFYTNENAGMAEIGELAGFSLESADDFPVVLEFVREQQVDMVVVGPEKYLEMGLVDFLEDSGVLCFGTRKQASMLESSKLFAKKFMLKHGIPTAGHAECSGVSELLGVVGDFGLPVVLKADGLAAGKGVIICSAKEDIKPAAEKLFGISDKVVVEQFLRGTEASIMCFVDNKTIRPMKPARDHKRLLDGDEGPNTGGMGVVSGDILPDGLMEEFQEKVAAPFMKGIEADGIDFRGVLFVGIMYDEAGLHVLEFNTRFGDPETEAVLPLMEHSFYEVLKATAENRLCDVMVSFRDACSAVVVLAAAEYPYSKTVPVEILWTADAGRDGGSAGVGRVENGGVGTTLNDTVRVLHCGTRMDDAGRLLAVGGRVLAVYGTGDTLEEAIKDAYRFVKTVSFKGMQYRNDIGVLR